MFYARSAPGVTAPAGNEGPTPWRRLVHFFLPAPCLACGEVVWAPRGSLGLCPPCRAGLVRWPEDGCGVCGLFAGAATVQPCGACRTAPPPLRPQRRHVVLPAAPRRRAHGAQISPSRLPWSGPRPNDGESPSPRARKRPSGRCGCPLHWRRWLSRGYNQAALIARPLAKALGLPFVRLLRRRRATPPPEPARRGGAAIEPGRCLRRNLSRSLPRAPGDPGGTT